jgi:hypothetical protein
MIDCLQYLALMHVVDDRGLPKNTTTRTSTTSRHNNEATVSPSTSPVSIAIDKLVKESHTGGATYASMISMYLSKLELASDEVSTFLRNKDADSDRWLCAICKLIKVQARDSNCSKSRYCLIGLFDNTESRGRSCRNELCHKNAEKFGCVKVGVRIKHSRPHNVM